MGPCVAYCLCSRVGSVAVAVPAPTFALRPCRLLRHRLEICRSNHEKSIPDELRHPWKKCRLTIEFTPFTCDLHHPSSNLHSQATTMCRHQKIGPEFFALISAMRQQE